MKINVPFTIKDPDLGYLAWVDPHAHSYETTINVQLLRLTTNGSAGDLVSWKPCGPAVCLYLRTGFAGTAESLDTLLLEKIEVIKEMVKLAVGPIPDGAHQQRFNITIFSASTDLYLANTHYQ